MPSRPSSIAPGGFIYDAAGNVLNDGINQYVYDAESRLCAMQNGVGSRVGYLYDAEGRRAAKGALATLSCDMATNGWATSNSYVLGLNGEQVSETGGSAFAHPVPFDAIHPPFKYLCQSLCRRVCSLPDVSGVRVNVCRAQSPCTGPGILAAVVRRFRNLLVLLACRLR